MKTNTLSTGVLILGAILVFLVGYFLGVKNPQKMIVKVKEGFTEEKGQGEFCKDRCPEPDPSKWVLKTTVPPCPPLPDMSKYMLKTECPPQPDMSKYVLKTSVPACPPCISTCSKPCKIGECPPCPRPRCPTVKCPEPKACPACPAVAVQPCPEPKVQCKAQYESHDSVRPMLSSTRTFGF
jgi:hypothetical protein